MLRILTADPPSRQLKYVEFVVRYKNQR